MSVEYALQVAISATLTSDATLDGLIDGKVYDRVPPDSTFPYVHMRAFQAIDDSTDCAEGWEVFADLDVWSDAAGKPEGAQIASAVRDALHGVDIELAAPYALVEIRHRDTQVDDGGDRLLTRARVSFRALVERV
jgi:hypothetical protein